MPDEINAPAGAEEAAVAQVEAPAVVEDTPAASSREALERAMAATDKPVEGKPERARDPETGKFKAADEKPPEKAADAAPPEVKPGKPALARLKKEMQEIWGTLPPVAHDEIHRLHDELTAGIDKHKTEGEKFKADAEAFASLRQYHEMAKQSGTTLAEAVGRYVGLEQTLRSNPLAGVVQIIRNLNIDPIQFGHALAGLQPQQVAQMQQQQAPQQQEQPQQNQPHPLETRITQLEEQILVREVKQFEDAHPYFNEVRPTVARLIETGFAKDLSEAYDQAIRLTPEVSAKIEADKAAKAAPPPTTTQPDLAQTQKKAALSVTGTPSVGSNPSIRKPAGSSREALQSAFAQVGL